MYSYTFEGMNSFKQAQEKEVIENSSRKQFKCFEFESISNSKAEFGLVTKIRVVEVKNKQITPTTEWRIG